VLDAASLRSLYKMHLQVPNHGYGTAVMGTQS
jgi:hypothetical protein